MKLSRSSRREFLETVALGTAGGVLAGCASDSRRDDIDPRDGGFIDAHVHIWTPDTKRYPLAPGFLVSRMQPPSYTPEELFADCKPVGVTRIVLIQMNFYGVDNSYMTDMIREHAGVFSGVAQIDENDNPREAMKALARHGVRGFRITSGGQGPMEWLSGEGMAAMWKYGAESGLALCPLIDPNFLPSVSRMCDRFPSTPVVVDHFGRIGVSGEMPKDELDDLCELARHPNVKVKASAFYALGQKKAPYLDLEPMIRRVLDAFGRERVMWASDCPFQVMGGHSYRESIALVRDRLSFLGSTDRDWILRKTAEKTFF